MSYRLFVMRHFQTHENETGVYMGQQDYQINPDSVHIDDNILQDIGSVHVISSPLLRSVQSAMYIMNNRKEIEWSLETTELIKERCLGAFEGRKKEELNSCPDYFSDKKLILSETPPQGEDIVTFSNRVNSIIPYIQQQLRHTNVLLITHLQVLRVLCCTRLCEAEWYSIDFSFGQIVEMKLSEGNAPLLKRKLP